MEQRKHPSPADVAEAFVKQYYVILHKSPENLHKFYQESSLIGWPGVDGVISPVTTLDAINEKVMSSDYKNCYMEVKTTDAQESLDGGIIVAVTGCLTGKDNAKKNVSQTFVLAKQEKGFFVLNDILRFFDVCNSTTDAAGSIDDKIDQPGATQDSAPCDTCDVPSSLDFKAAIQNGKIEGSQDLSLPVSNLASSASSSHSVPSGEMAIPPQEDAKRLVATNEKVPPVVKPAINVKVTSDVTPALSVPVKITYASMLAKEIPATSPRTAPVASNVSKQAPASSSPTTKPSSPRVDASRKASSPSGGASTSLSKVTPKSPPGSRGPPRSNAYAEAKGIYIGGLPYDITKQGIVDVVKQFGQVHRHSDTVQIRRHEDGFCCGFVEFESADSARRAVEAHHVMFGDKEAYITYKRLPYNRGNDGQARSPTLGEQRNSSSTGRENDDWTYCNRGRGRGPHRSNSSDQQARQTVH